jgi:intein/homing endonuclease
MGKPRTYSIDENYFNEINSNNKAYILGFIYADGSVCKNYLSIWLSDKDIEILEFIKLELKYEGKIYVRNNEIKNKKYVGFSVSSKKMVNDLIKLGVVRNKTYLSKELPIYDKKYEAAFLRGFFDGDGSIYLNNNRGYDEYTICFSGNIRVLGQIKNILIGYDISSCNIRHRHSSDESCMLEIRGNLNIEKIYNLFYNNADFYLKRKKERFNNFKLMLTKLIKRNLSDEIINNIRISYCSGMKQFQIANDNNMPKSSVRTVIQRLRKYGEVK